MTPQAFIDKWTRNKLTEKAGAQHHFLDLCDLLDVPKPDDPDNYCFERGAKRTGSKTAGTGWADVWKRNCFAWEYKGPNAGLEAALLQLMTYTLALDNPPLLVVSNRQSIEIHTHFTGTPSEIHVIPIADIGLPENVKKLRWIFNDPDQFKPTRTRTAITLQAAKLIGDLAWQLQQRKHDPQQVAHFLNKVIFCLFAEDAKGPASEALLPQNLFTTILSNGRKDIARFDRQLKNLFRAMSERHGEFGEHFIQWFNGGLFDDDITIPLNTDDIDKLINVSLLDWSAIEPSIFGTLFERGLDPAKRSQLGAHYTDPVSIMRIVNPVIVEPLLSEWALEKSAIAAHMAVFHEFENSRKSTEKAKATNALKDATKRYIGFKERLKDFKVLDPACGSGNFLYLALQALKDIELRVGLEAEALGLERGFPEVGPQAMHGIEISPYAAELAKVTVWIGDIQWMLKHGFAPSREPILKTLDQIQCRDALLNIRTTQSDDGGEEQAITMAQWPLVHAIIGNPPFLGGSKMREQLGDAYTEDLRAMYQHSVPGGADLVCYWFAKAQHAIAHRPDARAGLVATNSIRGGANRKVLEQIVETGEINNAWSNEAWVNEGAAVRVSIVCFAHKSIPNPSHFERAEKSAVADDEETLTADSSHEPVRNDKFLDGRIVTSINADLSGNLDEAHVLDLTKAKKLNLNSRVCAYGSQEKGSFDILEKVARAALSSPNPDRRKNADVVKRAINASQVTKRRLDTWVIDFGLNMPIEEAAMYETPFSLAKQQVYPERSSRPDKNQKDRWWLHARPSPVYREMLARNRRYIASPAVAKHRVFVWLDKSELADHALLVFGRDDDASFGILHSRMHELWSLRLGTSLEDRPRYTPTTCFETFPFPEGLTPNLQPADSTNSHAAAIAAAAKRLNELRTNWLNPPEWVDVVPEVVAGYPDRIIAKPEFAKAIKERTLTNLYNARAKGEAQWLSDAHRALDAAVAAAYGWTDYTPAMADEEILRRLLALNLARAASEIADKK